MAAVQPLPGIKLLLVSLVWLSSQDRCRVLTPVNLSVIFLKLLKWLYSRQTLEIYDVDYIFRLGVKGARFGTRFCLWQMLDRGEAMTT